MNERYHSNTRRAKAFVVQTTGKAVQKHTPLQAYFLSRLSDLCQSRENIVDQWMLPILNRAIYSTFQDCINTEVGVEARAVLHGEAFHLSDEIAS